MKLTGYNGEPDRDLFERLDRLIDAGPFHVQIHRTFLFEEAAEAHRAPEQHNLGKLVFSVSASA